MELWDVAVRAAVQATMGRYTTATDAGRLRDLAACFAEAGVLEIDGVEPLRGRERIRAGLIEAMAARPPVGPAPSYVQHQVGQPRFHAVTPDRVSAASYFTVMTDAGVDHWGRYDDVLVPVGEDWLFLARRITVAGFAATSRMRPAQQV